VGLAGSLFLYFRAEGLRNVADRLRAEAETAQAAEVHRVVQLAEALRDVTQERNLKEAALEDKDRALAAERLAKEQITSEKERAEKALADAATERGTADDLIKNALLIQCLYGAIDAEQKGAYELAERTYRSAREMFRTREGAEMAIRAYRRARELVPIRPREENGNGTVTLHLCRFYSRRNTPEKGEPLLRELLAFHKQHPEDKPDAEGEVLLRILGPLGSNLLQQHKWVDAEEVLRECLTVCDGLDKSMREDPRMVGNVQSVGWPTRSMIGHSLVGQRKYAEAEPYLLDGYKGGKELVDTFKAFGGDLSMLLPILSIEETVERLVQLYEAWDKPDEAAKWRKELDAFKK
jgi:hypothetical protein